MNKEVLKKFSKRLKSERLLKGWTQAQVAFDLGITQSAYCRYERGGTTQGSEPDFEMLCKIAKLFEVSADYLLGLSD